MSTSNNDQVKPETKYTEEEWEKEEQEAEEQEAKVLKERRKNLRAVVKYLEKYEVMFEPKEMKQLVEELMNLCSGTGSEKVPGMKVADCINADWLFWSPFLRQSEDVKKMFFAESLKSLCSCHASATSSCYDLSSYIGKKVPEDAIVKSLPVRTSTSFSLEGKLLVNGAQKSPSLFGSFW